MWFHSRFCVCMCVCVCLLVVCAVRSVCVNSLYKYIVMGANSPKLKPRKLLSLEVHVKNVDIGKACVGCGCVGVYGQGSEL